MSDSMVLAHGIGMGGTVGASNGDTDDDVGRAMCSPDG